MATVVFERVSKSFGRVRAVDELSFTIREGTILGLLGPNGSGKSTMLKLIAGLYRPDAGRVTIDGQEPSPKTKAMVAYLPEIDYLYGWMTVRQTLEYVSAFYADWDRERAEGLLKFMGLDPGSAGQPAVQGDAGPAQDRRGDEPQRPGGAAGRAAFGDRPTSRSRVLRAIVSEFRADSQTVVMSTHDVVESEALFDEVLFFKDGPGGAHRRGGELREERGKSIQELFEEVYA